MADSEPVQFFDLWSDFPGPAKSWSYNTLKVRAVLNFKGIPYTQSWISYPDIKPLGQSLVLPPNAEGTPYTLPIIAHKSLVTSTTNPRGALMDSLPIVLHLDRLHPSPPLFPSGDASYSLFVAVARLLGLLQPAYRTLIVPRVAEHLDPRGQKYFYETREVAFGKPLSEVRPTDQATLDKMWAVAETESAMLLAMLRGRDGKKGPFFEGETAGYADLVFAGVLAFIGRFDAPLFDKFMGLGHGEFKALYEACRPWLEGQGEDKEWPISASS